ncbi:hypothetical protein PENTCL1PPCAC_20664, partial [Pristionchus entomophagus]
ADSCDSPMEEALFQAVATPERMRLFVILWLAISGAIVLGLERAFVANMNLITPGENVQAGLPSREHLSRIGVAEIRDFLHRREIQRQLPTFGAYHKAFLKFAEERNGKKEMKRETIVPYCRYFNTTISIRSPSSAWSQCSRADAPVFKPAAPFVHLPVHSPNKTDLINKSKLTWLKREMKKSRMHLWGSPALPVPSSSSTNLSLLRPSLQSLPCIPNSVSRPCDPSSR